MKIKVQRLRALFIILSLVIASLPSLASSATPPIRLIHSGDSGLVIEGVSPPVMLTTLEDGAIEVRAEGFRQARGAGLPRIPFYSVLIAIPAGAEPVLRLTEIQETRQALPAPLSGEATSEPLRAITTPVVLEKLGTVRGIRLARLVFYPAIPEGDQLRITRYFRAEIRWSGKIKTDTPPALDPIQALVRRNVLNPWDAIPSYAPVKKAVAFEPTGGQPVAFIEVTKPGLYRITYEDLSGMGFQYVNPRYLRLFRGDEEVACEWEGDDDETFEPGEALLFYAEPRFSRWTVTDVYKLIGDTTPGLRMGSRSADPTGLPAGTRWVEEIYEVNAIYTPDCLCGRLPAGRNGDRWVWQELRRPGKAEFSYSFKLPYADTSRPASLTLWLIGYTDVAEAPDHRVSVFLNDADLGQVEWDGKNAITATLQIPAGTLTTVNALTLTLPGIPGVSVEGAWLDAFAIRYAHNGVSAGSQVTFGVVPSVAHPSTLPHRIYLPLVCRNLSPGGTARAYSFSFSVGGPYRAYDVTDPLRPQRLTDFQVIGNTVTIGDPPEGGPRRYFILSESGILRPERIRPEASLWGSHTAGGASGADYLIITHPDFLEALTPLIELRQSQGFTVATANVLGIYDAYGDGRPDPEAIRSFIAEAYATWSPRPTYVLLVGDGTFDPKQYRSDSQPTWLPPYLAEVDPWAGEAPADNRYACVDGDDNLPDLLIGRLPVNSPDEARAVVAKIVSYEADPLPGDWNRRHIFVADDPDEAGDFHRWADQGYAYVSTPYQALRLYCVGDDPSSLCENLEEVRSALLREWDYGAQLLTWVGHSSWHQWEHGRLFHIDDVTGLTNNRRWPMVLEMTCFTGFFDRPETPVLDEALLLHPEGGAIAVFGPAGAGISSAHGEMLESFYRGFFEEGLDRTGFLTLQARLGINTNLYPELVDTYHLFGDPATRLY